MGDFLNGIFGFLGGAVESALSSFVVWLYQLIIAIFQVLYQLLGFVAQFFYAIAKGVANFFDRLWNGFFKGIFTKVWGALKAAHTWLELKLKPLIDFLTKLRKLLQIYYNTYIRPILLFIQRIRQFLQILTALHIGFAQKLDQWLAQLQAKIVTSFATIIGTINTLTNIANALMDPTYLLRKPALILSIRRQIPALIHAVTGRPPGYWFPSPKGAKGSPFAPPSLPFNFTDTAANPPTSHYMSYDDGIAGIGSPDAFFQFADGSVDATQPLDYFNDDLYTDSPCTDPAHCLAQALGIYTRT